MSETQWIFASSLISALTVPVMLTVFTVLFYLGWPKKRNRFSGYRTRRSMQSEESWAAAQKISRKYFLVYTLILWPVTVLLLLFTPLPEMPGWSVLLLTAESLLILPVIPITEKKLKGSEK